MSNVTVCFFVNLLSSPDSLMKEIILVWTYSKWSWLPDTRQYFHFLSLSHIPRQDIHHDWQRQHHSEPRHCALCHFLALQAHQWAQREDGHTLLSPCVCGGNLWKRWGAERLAVWGVNRQSAGRPVAGNPSERGSHLWHSGERHPISPLSLCSLILSFSLWVIKY